MPAVPPLRARAERFGAIVELESPPALVSIDRALARELGVDGGPLWEGESPGLDVDALSAPIEAHVAITERCPSGCSRCYAGATPKGHEPELQSILSRLDALASQGTFRVAIGGGEPSLHPELGRIAAHARSLGLVPTVTTSGIGVTAQTAPRYRAFAQVNVSYEGAGEIYRDVRGYDGAAGAESAMRALAGAGVPFGVNTVLTRASWPHVGETAARAEALGAREIQLLRLKPSGRGRLDYLASRLTPAQIAEVPARVRSLVEERSLAVRIDCALVPFLAPGISDPQELVRLGVMGCEAGRSLVAIRAHGAGAPCSFWPDASVSGAGWDDDPTLASLRAYGARPPEPCASCAARASCRSGCRIVAEHLTGDPFAPDPECPRVGRSP